MGNCYKDEQLNDCSSFPDKSSGIECDRSGNALTCMSGYYPS